MPVAQLPTRRSIQENPGLAALEALGPGGWVFLGSSGEVLMTSDDVGPFVIRTAAGATITVEHKVEQPADRFGT